MLGLGRSDQTQIDETYLPIVNILSRPDRRMAAHAQIKTVNARDLTQLRAFLPCGAKASYDLSRTQFLERCTRISVMGRLQIYDFHYYRRIFHAKSQLRRFNANFARAFGIQNSFMTSVNQLQIIREFIIPP